MKQLKCLFFAATAFFPLHLFAHGYWIELEGSHRINEAVTVKLIFGEYSLAEKLSGEKLDRMKDIKVFLTLPDGSKKAISMTQQTDCWKGEFFPTQEGLYTITGINDTREVQDWTKHGLGITRPVQYLKAEYRIGTDRQKTGRANWLDIDVRKTGERKYELFLTRDGQPVDTCLVTIVNPAGEEEEIKTGKDGKVVFTTSATGMYLVGVQWVDENPGVFRGKEYKTIRHKLDYSLYEN
jgi:hypothetical protein